MIESWREREREREQREREIAKMHPIARTEVPADDHQPGADPDTSEAFDWLGMDAWSECVCVWEGYVCVRVSGSVGVQRGWMGGE